MPDQNLHSALAPEATTEVDVDHLALSTTQSLAFIQSRNPTLNCPEHHVITELSQQLLQQADQFGQAISQSVKAAHEGRKLAGEGVKMAMALSDSSETAKGPSSAVVPMTEVMATAFNHAVTMNTAFQHIRGNVLQISSEIPTMIAAIEEETAQKTDDTQDVATFTLHFQQIHNDLQILLKFTNHFTDFWDQRRCTLATILQDLPQMQTDSSNPLRIVMVEKRLSDLLALYSRQITEIEDFARNEMQTGGEIGFTELSVAPRLPIPGSQYRSSDDALRPPSAVLDAASYDIRQSNTSGTTHCVTFNTLASPIPSGQISRRGRKDSTTTKKSLTQVLLHNSKAFRNAVEKRLKGDRADKRHLATVVALDGSRFDEAFQRAGAEPEMQLIRRPSLAVAGPANIDFIRRRAIQDNLTLRFYEEPPFLDIDVITTAALNVHCVLASWHQAHVTVDHPAIVDLVRRVEKQASFYLLALANSLERANDGVEFANAVLGLCDSISGQRRHVLDITTFLHTMKPLIEVAYRQARAADDQLRAIRRELLEIFNSIPRINSKIMKSQKLKPRTDGHVIVLPGISPPQIPASKLERYPSIPDHQFLPKSFHDIEILLAGVNRDLDVLIKQFRHGLGWWGMLQHLSKPAATPEVNVSHIRERWTAVRDDFTLYIRRLSFVETQDAIPQKSLPRTGHYPAFWAKVKSFH